SDSDLRIQLKLDDFISAYLELLIKLKINPSFALHIKLDRKSHDALINFFDAGGVPEGTPFRRTSARSTSRSLNQTVVKHYGDRSHPLVQQPSYHDIDHNLFRRQF